jgi:tetratricopeptide (TPR) repeat protein
MSTTRPLQILAVLIASLAAPVIALADRGAVLPAGDGPGSAAYASMMQAWSAGNLDAALKAADKVLAAEPQNVAYLGTIGGLYCEQAQKANVLTKMSWAGKCRGTWERALVIDPKNIDIRFNLIQYYAMAPGIAGGGIGKAKNQAKAIAALDAVRGEIAWGNIARSEKQQAEAERRYRKAADLDAAGTRGPAALASFYASEKRWKDARAIFEIRLAKDQGDAFAVYQLARLMQLEGTDLPNALAFFDRYLAVAPAAGGPSHADAWFRKGEILLKLGRKPGAISAFESALTLAPDHRGAAAALARAKRGGL